MARAPPLTPQPFLITRQCSPRAAELEEGGFKTIGVYIYVPSMVDGERWIEINGQPHPKLTKLISDLLDIKLADIAKN